MIRYEYLLFVGRRRHDGTDVEDGYAEALADMHGDPQEYNLQVVVVDQDPELAERHTVIATPTLIRTVPLPSRRVVGVTANPDMLAEVLGHPF